MEMKRAGDIWQHLVASQRLASAEHVVSCVAGRGEGESGGETSVEIENRVMCLFLSPIS